MSIQAKEGIVLDREDRESRGTGARMQVRVYRGGWWLPLALGLGVPVMFMAGVFFFTVLLTLGILTWILRSLLRPR